MMSTMMSMTTSVPIPMYIGPPERVSNRYPRFACSNPVFTRAPRLPGQAFREQQEREEWLQIDMGVSTGRSRVHAPGQRLAHAVLDRDDSNLLFDGFAQERHVRVGPFAVGSRLRTLGNVASGTRRGHPTT